jgi:hypothetical protein
METPKTYQTEQESREHMEEQNTIIELVDESGNNVKFD